MNAYQKAQQLGLNGDDATQFATLRQYGLTHERVMIADLLFLLSERNMMVRLVRPADTGEKWGGSLVNMILYVTANGSEEQVVAVGKFFSHITNDRNTYFDTTNPVYSAPMIAMMTAFGDKPGMPTTSDFTAIAALGGGWIATTLEDFTAQREAAEKAESDAAVELITSQKRAAITSAISQATAAVQQRANEESEASLPELIATFTATLTQHWSV